MADPILEEIWRVREELIKQHGGLEGYLDYIQQRERERRQREQQRQQRKARRQGTRK
jgi:hypothetical protein